MFARLFAHICALLLESKAANLMGWGWKRRKSMRELELGHIKRSSSLNPAHSRQMIQTFNVLTSPFWAPLTSLQYHSKQQCNFNGIFQVGSLPKYSRISATSRSLERGDNKQIYLEKSSFSVKIPHQQREGRVSHVSKCSVTEEIVERTKCDGLRCYRSPLCWAGDWIARGTLVRVSRNSAWAKGCCGAACKRSNILQSCMSLCSLCMQTSLAVFGLWQSEFA